MTPLARMGKRIAQYRKAQDWSQEQLAARAGISRQYLARLEMGRQDPRVSTLLKIAKALHVNIAALVE